LVNLPDSRSSAGLDADAPDRVARLLQAAQLAASLCPHLVALRNQAAPLSSLLACVQENEKNSSLISSIRVAAGALRESLVDLRGRLAGSPYPFNHAESDMTLDRYVFGFAAEVNVPDSDSISEVGSLANDA